jgi:hypothetical protein
VPDTDPRLLHVTSDALDETVSVPADGVADLHVGRGEVRIRTAAGAVYELQPPVEEPRPRAATPRRILADVVVVVPDFGGSVLARDGKDVWSASGGALSLENLGRLGRELVLEDDPVDVDEVDGITAARVVDEVSLVPGLWRIDGYDTLRRLLAESFDTRAGENVFEFPYDWRRDHRVAARRLARLSAEWLSSWRRTSGASDARLVLVAHGTGGLVAQHFVEVLEGWRDTRLLISLGTPFGGTLVALQQLVEGIGRRPGFDLTDAVRSWTSVYQMLPTYPCVEWNGGEVQRVSEVRLPGVDPRRADEALMFHRELRAAGEQNRADADYTASGFRLAPVVGIEQPTLQSAALRGGTVTFLRHRQREDLGGDGVVPRPSAIAATLTDLSYALYVSERHASLQRSSDVLFYVSGLISGGPGPGVYRSARQGASLGLDLADAFLPNDPIEFRVFSSVAENPTGIIEDIADGERQRVKLRRDEDGTFAASAPPLAPGTYRLVVVDPDAGGSVSDIFVVTPHLKGEPFPP